MSKRPVNNDLGRREKIPLFPLDVECVVGGFIDQPPDVQFCGFFRSLKNHSGILFVYENGCSFRLAGVDHVLKPLQIMIVSTGEYWDYYH
jgi:hypothetical protein